MSIFDWVAPGAVALAGLVLVAGVILAARAVKGALS